MSDRRAERSRSEDRDRPEGRTRPSRGSHPARQTGAATSRRRGSWHGHGERTVTEKDPFGAFLDDVTYAFADVSFLAAPALVAVWASAPRQWFGYEGAALVAWTTMVVGAALIRGGWVQPLATDAPGWVAMTPWLVALRLGYYNAAMAVALLTGNAAEAAISPLASAAVAALVGALAVGVFPRIAESFYGVVAG